MRGPLLLLGATGTIGRAIAVAALARGYSLICSVRPHSTAPLPPEANRVVCDLTDPPAVAAMLRAVRPEAIVSCMASRTGAAVEAWAVDHLAHSVVLSAAREAGVERMVLLSAICVQKPRLEFQRAKLAFEAELAASGLIYTIVRPTAFFKSLSGQVARVRAGRPYLLFGDGRGTACKPISDWDLATYLLACLEEPELENRILPVGGPGPAVSPWEQGAYLFERLGQRPRFRQIPVPAIRTIAVGLEALGRVSPAAGRKAEFARIAEYYATESMLVWDASAGRYDAGATPSYGSDTLWAHYDRLLSGEAEDDRGAHAMF
ncbi:MAG: NAD(P)H-binding protein [Pseudomonadota bacterium]